MRSLASLVALALCNQIFLVHVVFGEKCRFVLENGADIPVNGDVYNLPTIQDIEKPGKELLAVKAIDVVKIVTPNPPPERVYIDAVLSGVTNDQYLVLTLTDLFVDYEENESDRSTSIFVDFTCTDGTRRIEFVQPIEDTNNHPPEFENVPYIYNLPMPIPKNLPLDKFSPISARDIDLTNTNISFSLDSDISGFSVSWLSQDLSYRKRHYATLVTTAVISLVEDLTFQLHATDTGIPAKTATTTVTIRVDQENSILRFAQSLYMANLTNLSPGEESIIVPFGKIGLASGADKTVEYSIHDELTDYEKYFQLIPATDRSTVELRVVKPPEAMFLESFILLSLTATKPGATEKTVLHIYLPETNKLQSVSNEVTDAEHDYRTATIALGVILGIFVIGFGGFIFLNYRHRRK